jgi:hypothetical protein
MAFGKFNHSGFPGMAACFFRAKQSGSKPEFTTFLLPGTTKADPDSPSFGHLFGRI